jgi:hypothetical protein
MFWQATKRIAPDGKLYTKVEFLRKFGEDRWVLAGGSEAIVRNSYHQTKEAVINAKKRLKELPNDVLTKIKSWFYDLIFQTPEKNDFMFVEAMLKDFREKQEAIMAEHDVVAEDDILYPLDVPKFVPMYVDANRFNMMVGVVIVLNAVSIGVEADAPPGNEDVWLFLEVAFNVFFLWELAARLCCHGWQLFIRPNFRLNAFMDVFVVSAGWANVLLAVVFGGGSGNDVRILTMLRLTRLLRLVRVLRIFTLFKELSLLVLGLLSAGRTLLQVSCIMVALAYCFSIWFTLLVGQSAVHVTPIKVTAERYVDGDVGQFGDAYSSKVIIPGLGPLGYDPISNFRSILRSNFMMLKMLTGDKGWSFSRYVTTREPWLFALFFVIFIIGAVVLFNMMTGVVLERVYTLFEIDREYESRATEEERKAIFNQLEAFLNLSQKKSWDTHMLTVDELASALAIPEIYNQLDMLGFPVDDPAYYFRVLDADYQAGDKVRTLDFIRCAVRGTGPMLSKDVYAAQLAVQQFGEMLHLCEEEALLFEKKLSLLKVMARSLVEHGEHIFLNVQEYRARHPHFQSTFKPPISEAKLARAPWENEEEYFMALLGSWFESDEAENDESEKPTDPQKPPLPPLPFEGSLLPPPEPPAPLALQDEEDGRTETLKNDLGQTKALHKFHRDGVTINIGRKRRPVSAPNYASDRAIKATEGKLRPNRPVAGGSRPASAAG